MRLRAPNCSPTRAVRPRCTRLRCTSLLGGGWLLGALENGEHGQQGIADDDNLQMPQP